MRGVVDFSSWQGLLSTLAGLALVTLVAVGLRLLVMQRVQQRRERQNRQINERLKTLIAAYKTLGGSFTGELAVDPRHRRELRAAADDVAATATTAAAAAGSDRSRRIRDAVEAALSDVILLGTAEQVRLAAEAAADMVAGRRIETAALVLSLRAFIREALDLEAVPADVVIPKQGPLRGGGRGSASGGGTTGRGGGAGAGGGSGGGGAGGGLAAGGLLGLGARRPGPDDEPPGTPPAT